MKNITNLVKLTIGQSYWRILLSTDQSKVRENRRQVLSMSLKDWDKQMSEVLANKSVNNNVSPKKTIMMETAQEKKDWGLVHTPNGEWIYEYNAVFVPYKYVALLLIKAKRQGKKLAVYRQSKDSFWCYRHQLKALGFGNHKEPRHKSNNTEKNDKQ